MTHEEKQQLANEIKELCEKLDERIKVAEKNGITTELMVINIPTKRVISTMSTFIGKDGYGLCPFITETKKTVY